MKLHSDLPVYKAMYDLLIRIFRFIKDFRKEYNYTVGGTLKKEIIALLDKSPADIVTAMVRSLSMENMVSGGVLQCTTILMLYLES